MIDATAPPPPVGTVGVVVPVRSFAHGKSRLAPALDAPARSRLARRLADRVLDACDDLPVWVVTDDDEVAAWAAGRGVRVTAVGRPGLDAAARAGVAAVADAGHAHAVVAHADLPRARTLRGVIGDGLVVAPDRHHDGSNVVCVPVAAGFGFAYGPGSMGRHLAEGHRLGLSVTVVEDPDLAWDVDRPADLAGSDLDADGGERSA